MVKLFVVSNNAPITVKDFIYLLKFVCTNKKECILRQTVKQNADNILIGEILAKTVIKNTFGIDIAKQNFTYTEHGKPYLPDYSDVHFNISHSEKYVVCAVSDKPVGVDIQKNWRIQF